jgi:WD40 repeat protein
VLILPGHQGAICSLAYAPHGRTLASGSMDKTVRLWDLSTQQTTATLKGHRTYAHAVAFTPDGRLLASAGGDLYLRDPAGGRGAVARQEGGRPTAGLALAPDGRFLVTVGRRLGGANTAVAGDVKFWDTAGAVSLLGTNSPRPRKAVDILPADTALGEAALAQVISAPRWGAWSIALDPAGNLLAVGTDNGGVLLWDLARVQLRGRLEATAAVRSLAFSSDGRMLAAAEGSRIRVWNVQDPAGMTILKGHEKQVWSVAFAPGSSAPRGALFSGSQDGTVRVWDVDPPRERSVFSWQLGAVRAVATAPDGMTAAAGGEDGRIVVWDCDS